MAFLTSLQIWAKFALPCSLWFDRCLSARPFPHALPAPPFFLNEYLQDWTCDSHEYGVICTACNAFYIGHTAYYGVDRLHLVFTLGPFWLNHAGGLASTAGLFSILSQISRRAPVLTGVVFSIKSYWVCHLARHMHNKSIARSASSMGNTCLVAWFVLGL